jgi:hypothetical protein
VHGFYGRRPIEWPLRLVLAACAFATIVPKTELQLAATVVGTVLLIVVWRLARGASQAAPRPAP